MHLSSHILVPLGGSPVGQEAVPLALALGRRHGQAVELVHVHQPPPMPTKAPHVDPRFDREQRGEMQRRLTAPAIEAQGVSAPTRQPRGRGPRRTMRATVFHGKGRFGIEEVPRPHAGVGEAVIRVTLTTICGTDLHIVRGEYPVRPGLVIGHEPVGVIEELGPGVTGYEVGDRVLVGAITPCGQCHACLSGHLSQCGHGHGHQAIGGWRFGNTIDGAQAEYLLVPHAQANLAKIPDELTDEQVVLLADIASTGIGGAESGGVRPGDAVVVFAQGPIGLCATVGARLMGAALVIGVDEDETRLAMSRRMGADVVLDHRAVDVVAEIQRLTGGGADVAIEALGTPATFEGALRSLRPAGTLSSLGVYSGKLGIPHDAFAAGLGDHRIVTTLCPGGKERMRRLLELVRRGRIDLTPLLTHRFPLDRIAEAYGLFGERRDGVLKVAITP